MAVWGILGVCMLLDCREPALLLWVIVLYLAVIFPKVCVLFLSNFLVAFLRMLRCSLGPVQSSAPFLNGHVPPFSGRCGAFLRGEFLSPVQVLVGFVAVCVVHRALDGVLQISEVSFCLPVRALLFSPVDRLLCMVAMSLVGLMLVRVFVVLLCLPAQAGDR